MMSLDLMPIEQETLESTRLNVPRASDEQLRKFEGYLAEIFAAIGMDPAIPAFKGAPERFIHALFDAVRNSDDSPELFKILKTECRSGPGCRNAHVIEGPIHFFSLCERHSFPFFGHAYIGYIAREQIMGICNLTQLVRLSALQSAGQETIRQQIANALEALLHPYGIAVQLQVNHYCAQMQGLSASTAHTIVWRGDYSQSLALQTEFLNVCGLDQ
jgi:GTP cyclohydrolase I